MPRIHDSASGQDSIALRQKRVRSNTEPMPLHLKFVISRIEPVAVQVKRVPLGDQRTALRVELVPCRVELVACGVERVHVEHSPCSLRIELVPPGHQLTTFGVPTFPLAGKRSALRTEPQPDRMVRPRAAGQSRRQRAPPSPPCPPPALVDASPHRCAAASSATRASTQRSPCGVVSFFQNGACVFR